MPTSRLLIAAATAAVALTAAVIAQLDSWIPQLRVALSLLAATTVAVTASMFLADRLDRRNEARHNDVLNQVRDLQNQIRKLREEIAAYGDQKETAGFRAGVQNGSYQARRELLGSDSGAHNITRLPSAR